MANTGAEIATNSDVVINSIASNAQAATYKPASMFELFWNAGPMIKLVILSLLAASIYSWAIILQKHFKLKRLNAEANMFEDTFWSGASIEQLYFDLKNTAFDPLSNVFCSAMAEWESFKKKNFKSVATLEERMQRGMRITITRESDLLEKNMGFLSSLGTNGVIVGLFGTVLGIMNGFKEIAAEQSPSMAIVAPVIAEALFATALGILAAIPAALAYNSLTIRINNYLNRLETFSDEFMSIVSRQFDEEAK